MYIDRLIFVIIIAAYFFSPAVLTWISSGGTDWYRPYLVWLIIIFINYWVTQGKSSRRQPVQTENL